MSLNTNEADMDSWRVKTKRTKGLPNSSICLALFCVVPALAGMPALQQTEIEAEHENNNKTRHVEILNSDMPKAR